MRRGCSTVRGSSPVRGYISPYLPVSQVHFWLLANNHYIHGAYILEIVKEQWEHNTIKGDSFIPYPGYSLAGHTACAIDSSSLIIFGGNLETVAGFEQVNTSPFQPGPGPEPEPEPQPQPQPQPEP